VGADKSIWSSPGSSGAAELIPHGDEKETGPSPSLDRWLNAEGTGMEARALSRTAKSQILPRICSGVQTVAKRGLDAMRRSGM
jgi:hypothetical protein